MVCAGFFIGLEGCFSHATYCWVTAHSATKCVKLGKPVLQKQQVRFWAAVFILLTNTLGSMWTDQAATLAATWKWDCFKVWLKDRICKHREKQSARLSCKIAKNFSLLNFHACKWWSTLNSASKARLWLEPINKYFSKVCLLIKNNKQKKLIVPIKQELARVVWHLGVEGMWLFKTQDKRATHFGRTRWFQFLANHNCVTDLKLTRNQQRVETHCRGKEWQPTGEVTEKSWTIGQFADVRKCKIWADDKCQHPL